MKRIIKTNNSEVVKQNLKYPKDAVKIRELLIGEQDGFCAYTEHLITESFSVDIDHFNPTLKYTEDDNYINWFVISTKYNRKKSSKWTDFQPVLQPPSSDFELRIVYDYETGTYFSNPNDLEANNLISLCDLNNSALASERNEHINLLVSLFQESGKTDFIQWVKSHNSLIQFRRAIETVFEIKL